MASPIRIKRSAVSGKRPQLTDLQVGELALNTYDGFLFTERVGSATTVSNLTPWTESYGASSISYLNSVGIGTANPTEKLDVAGNINVGGGTTLQSSTTTGTGKALRIISPSGYIEVGSQNTSNAHFYTDRQRFYFNKKIVVDGGTIGSFNGDLVFVTDGSEERIRIKNDTGHVGINLSLIHI